MADSGGADDTVPPCENFDPDLVNQSYYHGWLPRDDLPHLLQRHGDFLVRITEADSLGTRLEMVLSALHDPEGRYTHRRRGPVNEEDIVHIIIQSVQHKYYMDDSKLFNTVDDLIDHFSRHSISVRDLKVRIRRAVCLGSWEFRAQDVRLGESIGKSGCIEVRKGSFEKDGKSTEASVTTVRGRSPYAKQTIVEMMRQCRMLRDLHHPCVVEFYGVCLLTHPCCFLLEYVSEGPLNEYLKKGQGRFKRDELLLMVMSAGWGLEFIHSHGIIHRDLGARNCFYDKQLVKISGFGLARKASTYTMKVLKKLSVHWMAPETVEEFLYSQKSDVYSFGILTYEIFSQKEPYEGYSNQEAKAFILEGKMNDFPPRTPKKLADFVNSKLWNNDPDDRPTMEQVIHWLSKYTGWKLQLGTLGVSGPIVHQNFSAPVMKDVDYKEQEDKTPPEKPVLPEDKMLKTPDSATTPKPLPTQAGWPAGEMQAQKTQALDLKSYFKPPGALGQAMTQRVPCQTATAAEYENIGALQQPKPISAHTQPVLKTSPGPVQMTARIPCQATTGAEYENIGALQQPKPISTHLSQIPKTASIPTQLLSPKPAQPFQQQIPPGPAPGTLMKPATAKPTLQQQLPQTVPIPGPGPATQQVPPRTLPIPTPGTPAYPTTAQHPRTAPIPPPGPPTHPTTAQVPRTTAIPAPGLATHPITAQVPPRTSPVPLPGTPTHPITAQFPRTSPIPAPGMPKTAPIPAPMPTTHPITAQVPPRTSPMMSPTPTSGISPHPATAQLGPGMSPIRTPGVSPEPITAQLGPKLWPKPTPGTPTHPITAQLGPAMSPIRTPAVSPGTITAQLGPRMWPSQTPGVSPQPTTAQLGPRMPPTPTSGISPQPATAHLGPKLLPIPTPGTPTHPITAQLGPRMSPTSTSGLSPHPATAQLGPRTSPIPTSGTPPHPISAQHPRTTPISAPGLPTHPVTGQVPKTTSFPVPAPPTHPIMPQPQKTAAIPAPLLPTHSAQQFPQQPPKTSPINAPGISVKPIPTQLHLQQLPSTSPRPITPQLLLQTPPKSSPIPVQGIPTRPITMQQPAPKTAPIPTQGLPGLPAKPISMQVLQQPIPPAPAIPTSVAAKPTSTAMAANQANQGMASSARPF